jgi:hypothetical protein
MPTASNCLLDELQKWLSAQQRDDFFEQDIVGLVVAEALAGRKFHRQGLDRFPGGGRAARQQVRGRRVDDVRQAGRVSEYLRYGDGLPFGRQAVEIARDRSLQVDLALFRQLHDGDAGK